MQPKKELNIDHKILEISFINKLSHIGSCLTSAPIIDNIYSKKEIDDKCIISCGHSHLAHAVVMEKYGIINSAEENILKHGIHCERSGGCDCSTGSLGQGLPIALGMALADRTRNVYCLISDGEATEGSVYEALNVMGKYNVNNLIVYCNNNGFGAYDKPYSVLRVGEIIPVNTSQHWFMKLYGQEAHYKVLNQLEYETCLCQ